MSSAAAALRGLDRALDRCTGQAGNPLRHLGAVAMLSFFGLAGTGALMFTVYDTSVSGAWTSVAQSGPAFGVLRSLHRYAADLFGVAMLAHLAREALQGRFHAFRRWSWLTGVALLPLGAVAAVGGFWLGWDRLAQFSLSSTAQWLDVLPVFETPFTRNIVSGVSDRLFSLLVFVHLGVALLLVFGAWAHLQRLARAEVAPPRPLAWGTALSLLALALLLPVVSAPAADLSRVPEPVALDWWLLWVHPLLDASSPAAVWALAGGALLVLCAMPWLSRAKPPVVAQVEPSQCNGCRRCFDDCPYAAVTMAPHPVRHGRELAVVDADLCAGCGICTGSCPSSTPLRSVQRLDTGIDMPQRPIDSLRRQLVDRMATLQGERRIVVFGCDLGAPVQQLQAPDVATLSFLCAGMLPPPFVDLALRHGADAVLVAGCRCDGCEFRLGMRWTGQRLAREREPRLRAAAPRERVAWVQADREELERLRDAVDRLRAGASCEAVERLEAVP